MCTVSIVPSNGQWILTSNRDELTERAAHPPQPYVHQNKTIWYPSDPKAGGTWFAVTSALATVVLLNGAEKKHAIEPFYRKSRGLIVLELLSESDSVLMHWKSIDLTQIEPFTLVVFEYPHLHQLRWDGQHKSTVALDVNQPHIWSSATLYSSKIRAEREQWFADFLVQKPTITAADLFSFHQTRHPNNTKNGLVMERSTFLKTISITQLVIDANSAQLKHVDLLSNNQSVHALNRE